MLASVSLYGHIRRQMPKLIAGKWCYQLIVKAQE
jgi:hypothetical protein